MTTIEQQIIDLEAKYNFSSITSHYKMGNRGEKVLYAFCEYRKLQDMYQIQHGIPFTHPSPGTERPAM